MRLNLKLYFKTIYYAFFKSKGTPGRLTAKRIFVLTCIFLFYPVWHLNILLSYFLDNLFYPDHHKQMVKQPIFIIGNFRSGTTFLHRLMSRDKDATSLTSLEIYAAPSIVGRKFLRFAIKINNVIGNPAQKIIDLFDRIMAEYSYMHKVGLNEVEEDGQVLFHIWSSYDLLAFFPFPQLVNDYIYYDQKIPAKDRNRDMNYYHNVLKKHIFVHGAKRYISKNPSYSPSPHPA